MTAPAISIVIPSYRGSSSLPGTLASLEASRARDALEVVVVDDGSGDGTGDAARRFAERLPLTVVAHAVNRGRSAAVNSGIRAARAPLVLILDDDMEVEPDAVGRHLEAHRSQPRSGVLGRIVTKGLDPARAFHRFLLGEEEWRRRRLLGKADIGFAEVWTGHFSVERDLAFEAGLFDEAIGIYGLEDIEFAYRLQRRGARFVYLDEAVTQHAAYAMDLSRYCRRHRLVGRVAAYVARKHDTPEMRRYLRLEAPPASGPRSFFLRLMDASAAMLRRPAVARAFASPAAGAVLVGGVRLLEGLRVRKPLSFLYSFLRDVQYFDALGRARSQSDTAAVAEPELR